MVQHSFPASAWPHCKQLISLIDWHRGFTFSHYSIWLVSLMSCAFWDPLWVGGVSEVGDPGHHVIGTTSDLCQVVFYLQDMLDLVESFQQARMDIGISICILHAGQARLRKWNWCDLGDRSSRAGMGTQVCLTLAGSCHHARRAWIVVSGVTSKAVHCSGLPAEIITKGSHGGPVPGILELSCAEE